jgi:hypothetical protein
MATALSMMTRAMRLAQVATKGESLDDDEAQDGLTALNAMLDSWQVDRLFVYQIQQESFTWAVNQQTRTVGAAGDFVTTLPARIADDCVFRVNNIDYPVQLIDVNAWSNIADKTTTNSFPWFLYPEYGAALVTLYAYPIPNASLTFLLKSYKQLQSFSSLTTALALPPGYERAITYSLAEEYGPEFGVEIPMTVQRIAAAARRIIRRQNSVTPVMASEAGYLNRRNSAYVYSDLA